LHLFPPKREVSELVSENNGPVVSRILDEMIASSLSLAKRSWRITATVGPIMNMFHPGGKDKVVLISPIFDGLEHKRSRTINNYQHQLLFVEWQHALMYAARIAYPILWKTKRRGAANES
jgi:hypothetical protein